MHHKDLRKRIIELLLFLWAPLWIEIRRLRATLTRGSIVSAVATLGYESAVGLVSVDTIL